MKIGLITTLNTNIGDDLIREGICTVLREIFKKHDIRFILINKHRPATVYPKYHPIRWTEILPRGRIRAGRFIGKLFYRFGYSYLDNCDLIVYCGAPVLWPGCHQAEWAEILWDQVVGRIYEHIPVLNIAAGSSYPWEKQPTIIEDPNDKEYLKRILGYCRLTTVRDILAQRLCATLDVLTPLIPCSAFLAFKDYNIKKQEEENIIIINYMPGGGHYDWNQKIDPLIWHITMERLIARLKKYYKLVFLCHSKAEYEMAYRLDPALPRVWPKTVQEYFNIIPNAKVALCNRMHASVALAALGIPSVAVGTDTRLLMVHALGLPIVYIKDAHVEYLMEILEVLLKNYRFERERLVALKEKTFKMYIEEILSVL